MTRPEDHFSDIRFSIRYRAYIDAFPDRASEDLAVMAYTDEEGRALLDWFAENVHHHGYPGAEDSGPWGTGLELDAEADHHGAFG